MRSEHQLRCLAVGLVLVTLQEVACASDAAGLTPFVGETAREFEARRREVSGGKLVSRLGVSVRADPSGHFFVQPKLDGREVRMLVDTGASAVTLSYEDAESMALQISKQDFTQKALTADGPIEAAPVQVAKIQIGDIIVRDVEALILPRGRLKISLLGMTFLKRLSAFEISGGKLLLRQ